MHRFDYTFIKEMMVPMRMFTMANLIYRFRQEEEDMKEKNPALFRSLGKIAKAQSVKSSNEIEGIVTSNRRMKVILDSKSDPLNSDEQQILGYKECLDFINSGYSSFGMTEKEILSLHGLMLGHTDYPDKGEFKKNDNVILERRKDGSSYVRWHPVPAKETKDNMEQLYLAYMNVIGDISINQLIVIPCFVLDFLCIHPFQDGNGRISRLLTLLLLYKAGFDVPRYISFEDQINKRKLKYYEALQRSSFDWRQSGNDYLPFIKEFITTLYYCYIELEKKLVSLKDGKTSKRKRIEDTVNSSLGSISKKQILDLLPDVSVTTVEKVLADLLKEGKIIKIGNTSNAYYVKNK